MRQQARDYRRFYGLMKNVDIQGDAAEFKSMLVMQFTGDRTASLREMTAPEYDTMCRHLQNEAAAGRELTAARHAALVAMEAANVDTQNWQRVNALCRDRRIAGKYFYVMTVEELKQLRKKMYAIANKGGLPDAPERSAEADKLVVDLAAKYFTA